MRIEEETIINLLRLGILTHKQVAASVAVAVVNVEEIAKRIQD